MAAVNDCPLTRREHEILVLVMRGLTYKQIALRLGVGASSIRTLMQIARDRLGVSGSIQAGALMIREEWVTLDEVLADWPGLPYSTASQRGRHTHTWVPSPAQRLYLDAFDALLRDRTDEAADLVDFYFGVMCRERAIPDRRRSARDVDQLLLRMARALQRPIAVAA